jgi:hypothetical protein
MIMKMMLFYCLKQQSDLRPELPDQILLRFYGDEKLMWCDHNHTFFLVKCCKHALALPQRQSHLFYYLTCRRRSTEHSPLVHYSPASRQAFATQVRAVVVVVVVVVVVGWLWLWWLWW